MAYIKGCKVQNAPGKINNFCGGVPTNSFALAGMSPNVGGSNGWSTVAANLAPT